ncbi:MAG: Dam family site-specific DNA-(adenine-N6)-methyltransferase [Defluviitaleaceae bacterium]|nr:Dam family site-specific DNA-(adenine-N6)-methyltransferase [Defluviitaleaceae bacterium]
MKKNIAKPFVKWAGGKGQLLEKIRHKYPNNLGTDIKKYAEPFIGGGAVLFDILNSYNLEEVYISDINSELIYTYRAIKDNVNELIKMLTDFEREYLSENDDKRKIMYYEKRDRFNNIKSANQSGVELAALFIFLNKTCFNGLYRVNSKGEYNVPQGKYKNPCICDKDNLLLVSEKLRNVNIINGDYNMSSDFIDDVTFCYFDPPYRPLTETSSFTNYSENKFDDTEQEKLAKFINEMSERGAYILASNSDPKNIDESDDFFDNLYKKYKILRVTANRAINSASDKRGLINELLIYSL